MKKLLLPIAVAALCTTTTAQQYIIVNGEMPVLATDVEKISYEEDARFKDDLLDGALAADAKTTLFSQALQLTGLADTLRIYNYDDYKAPYPRTYRYRSHTWNEIAWYNANRYRNFTVFAETDDVYAANGITNIEQLKAYAKQVYDEAFPEDASISDPTDRRNSLNRFVAYHILRHGSSYWYLTYYDGKMTDKFVDTNMTDIAVWYSTLMPEASIKCSYPMAGKDKGIYLNRRGLKDGPDKYGKQVRGAKVVAYDDTYINDPFTHIAFNGYYFYIDRLLAYDQTTRNDVLGSELWRVDLKTMSPDIMNNADELRGNYLVDDDITKPDDSPNPKNGRNYIYKWDCMENITGISASPGMVARRAHSNFWSWQGDEMNVFGDFYTITIKLPPLPKGEWEVRMGICAYPTRPDVRIYLNGQVTIDSLVLSRYYYDDSQSINNTNLFTEILDYLKSIFVMTRDEEKPSIITITDVRTGEQIINDNFLQSLTPLDKSVVGQYGFRRFDGKDPITGEYVSWEERAEQAMKDYLATLPKVMRAPRECMLFNSSGQQNSFYDPDNHSFDGLVRYPLGRIVSDGKSDNYLKIEQINHQPNYYELMLDYFEFVPKAVYDNPDIPEE